MIGTAGCLLGLVVRTKPLDATNYSSCDYGEGRAPATPFTNWRHAHDFTFHAFLPIADAVSFPDFVFLLFYPLHTLLFRAVKPIKDIENVPASVSTLPGFALTVVLAEVAAHCIDAMSISLAARHQEALGFQTIDHWADCLEVVRPLVFHSPSKGNVQFETLLLRDTRFFQQGGE